MTIELNPITSGYSTGLINDNFQALEDYVNDYLLHRDGVETGQPNQMELNLDMNGYSIINASTDFSDGTSFLTVDAGDERYVNLSGDTMEGPLSMGGYGLTVREGVLGTEPAQLSQLEQEIANRIAGDNTVSLSITQQLDGIEEAYQDADANLQAQISGGEPLEASAFSVISWHDQVVSNSVTIPDDKNAWSFGPEITVAQGATVTIGENSFWTIASGQEFTAPVQNFDEGSL